MSYYFQMRSKFIEGILKSVETISSKHKFLSLVDSEPLAVRFQLCCVVKLETSQRRILTIPPSCFKWTSQHTLNLLRKLLSLVGPEAEPDV